MKISIEIDEILKKQDRTNGGMIAKTPIPSKSHFEFSMSRSSSSWNDFSHLSGYDSYMGALPLGSDPLPMAKG
jgi:hypothetical protein